MRMYWLNDDWIEQRGRQREENRQFSAGAPTSPYAQGSSMKYESTHQESEDKTSWWTSMSRVLERDQSARNLFFMSLFLGVYAVLQVIWGLIVESHSLFAVAWWSLYMCINLGVTLVTNSIFSRRKPNETHPYGYSRFEVVAAFTNGSLLLFSALYTSFEAIEGFIEPVHQHENFFQLFLAVFGIVLHTIAATIFREALAPRTESTSALFQTSESQSSSPYQSSHSSHLPSQSYGQHHQQYQIVISSNRTKTQSLISHLLGPVSSLIVAAYRSSVVDASLAVLFSLYLFFVAIPLCWRSGRVLLQGVPKQLSSKLDRCLSDITRIEGVVKIVMDKTHFWTFSPGVHVGSVVVQVEEGYNEESIAQHVTHILKPYIYHLTVQTVVKRDHNHHHGSVSGQHQHHEHEHDDHRHHSHHNHSQHHDHNHIHLDEENPDDYSSGEYEEEEEEQVEDPFHQ